MKSSSIARGFRPRSTSRTCARATRCSSTCGPATRDRRRSTCACANGSSLMARDDTRWGYNFPVSVEEHHRHGHKSLKVGVLTASDSRSGETDESGRLIRDLLTAAGHRVEYSEVLPDDPARIRKALLDNLQGL